MPTGLIDLPWWGYAAVALAVTHVTIASVTIYLHRHQAHRALDLHPAVAHFFRFWLWLTTGTETRQWVAVHRCHHANVETAKDPHSPQISGIRKVLWDGISLYRDAYSTPEVIRKYGHGCPNDWLERNLYTRYSNRGYVVLLFMQIALFGPVGISIWAVQLMWIPFFAAGVINGLGHWWGYRNYETADASTNIVPVGVLVGGEELHNNHHAFASSAKFSTQWWELDVGWLYVRALEGLGLARVKKLPPKTILLPDKPEPDSDTLTAVLAARFEVMSEYASTVLTRVLKEEMKRADGRSRRRLLKQARSLVVREESLLTLDARRRLEEALTSSQALDTAYRYKRQLQAIWQERTASSERLLHALQEWCREAETSGVRALQDFARTLPRYTLQSA